MRGKISAVRLAATVGVSGGRLFEADEGDAAGEGEREKGEGEELAHVRLHEGEGFST